jgi:tRNA G18 (ribose-2'-O)-methylase SpoU
VFAYRSWSIPSHQSAHFERENTILAISITQSGDPRVAAYVSIRERDLTRGHGARFIVEGKVALRTLLTRSRFAVESVFLCETRVEPLSDLLAHVPEGVPVYTAPQAVMDEIAGFPVHRGVLACGVKGDGLALETCLQAPRLLIASQISNHDNVGALFRNAAAFGVGAVVLDGESCDPLYRKAIRVSSGASLWLPFHHAGSAMDIVQAAQDAGYTVWAMTPRADAAAIARLALPDRLAVLVGAEGPGLPDAVIEACVPVRIPMTDGFDSINVATAAAIALSAAFGG